MFYLGIVVDLPKSFKDSEEFHGGFSGGSDSKEYTCNAGHLGSIPGLGRSPGGGKDNPLWYSCLEHSMDGEAWLAAVHRVTKSWTQLSDLFLDQPRKAHL